MTPTSTSSNPTASPSHPRWLSLVRPYRDPVSGYGPWWVIKTRQVLILAYTANGAALHYKMLKRRMERGEAA